MKSLRTFLDDMRRIYANEVVTISKTVNPLAYDVTAIVKQLGALKRFPILLFDNRSMRMDSQPTSSLSSAAKTLRRKYRWHWVCPLRWIAPKWRAKSCAAKQG